MSSRSSPNVFGLGNSGGSVEETTGLPAGATLCGWIDSGRGLLVGCVLLDRRDHEGPDSGRSVPGGREEYRVGLSSPGTGLGLVIGVSWIGALGALGSMFVGRTLADDSLGAGPGVDRPGATLAVRRLGGALGAVAGGTGLGRGGGRSDPLAALTRSMKSTA